MKFSQLIETIRVVHEAINRQAVQNVNTALTLRNRAVGGYIVEFEQKGEDRAKYGDNLVRKLSDELNRKSVPGMSYRSLELYKRFYLEYPRIVQTQSAQSGAKSVFPLPPIRQTLSDESGMKLAERLSVPVEKHLAYHCLDVAVVGG